MRRFRRAGRGEDYARERVSRPGLVMLALVIFAFGFIYAYPRLKGPPLVRRDFVGRVVDKSLTLRESMIGTAALPSLLVEDGGGRRFDVAVNSEQYERARVGMWVRRGGGEVRLSWDEPAPRAPVGGDNARVR
ncbi:MAG TPA: hypothetical protein VGB98_07420 [Pyrinomonadaceae bacterium]